MSPCASKYLKSFRICRFAAALSIKKINKSFDVWERIWAECPHFVQLSTDSLRICACDKHSRHIADMYECKFQIYRFLLLFVSSSLSLPFLRISILFNLHKSWSSSKGNILLAHAERVSELLTLCSISGRRTAEISVFGNKKEHSIESFSKFLVRFNWFSKKKLLLNNAWVPERNVNGM